MADEPRLLVERARSPNLNDLDRIPSMELSGHIDHDATDREQAGGEDRRAWQYYNAAAPENGPAAAGQIDSYLSRVDFSSQEEDVRQTWFHSQASRVIAEVLLEGRGAGAFLVRPSSHRSAYAISWVVSASHIRHDLVYALCPGYALTPKPNPENRFWSLSTLVAQCSFLREAVPNCDTDVALVNRTLSQKGSEVIARIVERLRSNAPTLRELHWQLSILEGVVDIDAQTIVTSDRVEQRTFVRYCNEDYSAPCLIPLQESPAERVFTALRTNTTLTSLNINGHKGFLRMNFTPNCGDKEAQLLAHVLRENTTLTSLDLSVNGIGNEGATYLAQALRGNRTLRKLKLCHNMIQSPGLISIAELLRSNTVLEEVEVSGQLRNKSGVVMLGATDYERLLILLIESTLKRRLELLERSLLPCFCRFMTPAAAAAFVVQCAQPGEFIFYLNPLIPSVVNIASKPLARGSMPAGPQRLHVVDAGFGLLREKRPDASFPSLFDHCAWFVCSSPALLHKALAVLPADLCERVHAASRLSALWNIRSLPSQQERQLNGSSLTWPLLSNVVKWLALKKLRPMQVQQPQQTPEHAAERMQQYGFNP